MCQRIILTQLTFYDYAVEILVRALHTVLWVIAVSRQLTDHLTFQRNLTAAK